MTLFICTLILHRAWVLPKVVKNKNNGKPEIIIIHVPKYDTYGSIEGKIERGMNFRKFGIACYPFNKDGLGNLNKPFWSLPTTKILVKATFRINVTSGDTVDKAMAYVLFLVPEGYSPPVLRGGKFRGNYLGNFNLLK